jgi:hypothetical protein
VLLEKTRHGRDHGVLVEQVECQRVRITTFGANLTGGFVEPGGVARREHDTRAGLGVGPRHREPEPTRATRDERRLARETEQVAHVSSTTPLFSTTALRASTVARR